MAGHSARQNRKSSNPKPERENDHESRWLDFHPALTNSLNRTGTTDDHTVRHAWGHGTYPQTPYGQPPQPPKKRRTWLIVLLIILAVMLIGIVSWVALVGTAGRAVDEAITEVSASEEAPQQAEEDPNAPREVTAVKAFTIGSHKVLKGWAIKQDTRWGTRRSA